MVLRNPGPIIRNPRFLADGVELVFGTGSDWTMQFDAADLILQGPGSSGLTIGLAASAPAPDQNGVHIWSGTAGTLTAPSLAVLIIESSTSPYISFLTPNNTDSTGISWGDPESNEVGRFVYNHVTNAFSFRTAGNTRLSYSAGAFAFQEATIVSSTDALSLAPTNANGSLISVKKATELLSGLSGATATSTNLIPDGALVLAVVTRVTTAITGATSFDIGDGVDADRWGATIAVAAGTTSGHADYTATTVQIFTSANSIVLTANGSNFTGGAVRVTVYYIDATAPTS